MTFETILILSAVIQVVTLICFFVLCANVASIKRKMICSGIPPETLFSIYLALGKKEKAQDILIEMILSDSEVRRTLEIENNLELFKSVIARYDVRLKLVDLSLDAEEVFKTKRIR